MKKNLFILSCECMFLFLSTFIPNDAVKNEKMETDTESISPLVKIKQEYFSYQVPSFKEVLVDDKKSHKNETVVLNDVNNNVKPEENVLIDINFEDTKKEETSIENNEDILLSTDKKNTEVQDENIKQLGENTDDYEEDAEKLTNNLDMVDNNVEHVNNLEDNNESIKKMGYYSPNGTYLGDSKVKVIDVSHHQGKINWDEFVTYGDYYGVILRIGYYKTLDKQFENNISEIKRLNIPYGIYLFSYASSVNGAMAEMNFTNYVIDKYNLNPSLGIYYDIESWNTKTSSSDNISKHLYDDIINTYVKGVSNHVDNKYKVKLYSGRWYAMNRLGDVSKSYVDWVAEYNSTCKYDGVYSMWQYTSNGRVPGIKGNVDISYLY